MSQGFASPFLAGQQASTVTTFTSGSGTYTVPTGVQYLVVTMCGGGGGGGGVRVGKGAGGNGGTTSFGSWTAIGGNGAIATNGPNNPSTGATGGTGGTSGSGTQIYRVSGAQGGSGIGITSIGMTSQGPGGGSILSGGNAWFQGTADVNGLPGMGQGGGGAGAAGSDNSAAGGGGGGEQVQFLITSPTTSYSYAVGAGGTAGAGSATGGVGGSGVIIIFEYYSLLGITGTLNLPLAVDQGGSGRTSATAYGVLCGGTTSTGAQQSIASVGTSGQVLTSNGAGALPTFQSIITDWVAYTPTFTGFGTPTNVQIWSRRVGDTLYIRGRFAGGTTTATEARITLGYNGTNANVTSSSTKITSIQLAGFACYNAAGNVSNTLIESNVGYLTFGTQNTGTVGGGLAKQNGNALLGSGTVYSFQAEVPVDTWP